MRPTTSLPLSFVLALLLGSVQAQDQGQNSSSSDPSSYVSQAVSALQSAGFTGLAETLTKINGTPPANELFAQLASGRNFTVFAPDNEALQQIPSQVSENNTLLAEYISYHFVDGDFTNSSYTNSSSGAGGGGGSSSTMTESASSTDSASSTETSSATQSAFALFGRHFVPLRRQDGGGNNSNSSGSSGSSSNPQPYAGIWPNVTLGRTLLNASELVQLEGNKSQVLAWTLSSPESNVTILNQAVGSQNITVVNGTTWQNLFVNGINGTLIPPGNLSTALTAINATALQNVVSGVQVPSSNGTNETVVELLQNAHGITVFVPANDAFTSEVNSTLEGLQSNTSAVQALIQNHYINGTTLYSTQISNGSEATTAAGEDLRFVTNETGIFINGANNSMAQVIRPDVLLNNGVAHVVSQVFLVTESDQSDAADAYESAASSAAAHSTTETGPIGGIAGASQTQTSEQSSSTQSSSSESSSQSSSTETPSSSTESGGGETSTETATATSSA